MMNSLKVKMLAAAALTATDSRSPSLWSALPRLLCVIAQSSGAAARSVAR